MQIDSKKNNLKNKGNGWVFWITGLSGAGKTSIANLIKKKIDKRFGPTILINGDDIRKIFSFKSYTFNERQRLAIYYSDFCQEIVKQNINIIFTVVGLFNKVHKYNKKKIKNYCEIFIKTDVKKIVKFNKKRIYKYKKNIVGIDIKPEFPIKPNIIITNNFTKNLNDLSNELYKKIINQIY